MSGLTVITPTGGRPEAFALCEHWMARQTYHGDVQWIVVDDCEPATVCTMGQTVIRPELRWRPGDNTLGRNLLAALFEVRYPRIAFVEDDDFYAPGYLQAMVAALDLAELAGEVPSRYYNVRTGQHWRGGDAPRHASLCQTAMRAELIPALAALCRKRDHIDMHFWQTAAAKVWVHGAGCVGIKGLPGRTGIGMGHRPRSWWPRDTDGSVLRQWIGEDAAAYTRYAGKVAA